MQFEKWYFISISLLILAFGCSDTPQNKATATRSIIPIADTIPPEPSDTILPPKTWKALDIQKQIPVGINYTKQKQHVIQLRDSLQKISASKTLSKHFEHALLNQIIPYWYGTTWTFDGYTATPNEGSVGCSYFISTTLKHMGLKVNRYKLAQQSPINEARSVAVGDTLIELHGASPQENIEHLEKTLEEGLYFVGLESSHVGYLLKRQGELFLIHGNYMGNVCVEIERARDSEVFNSFYTLYIARISTNPILLQHWVEQRTIPVILDD